MSTDINLSENWFQFPAHINSSLILRCVLVCYLDTINDTTVAYVEGVHHKHEDNGLEDGLAHVLEREPHEEELRYDERYHLGRSQPHH